MKLLRPFAMLAKSAGVLFATLVLSIAASHGNPLAVVTILFLLAASTQMRSR